ncbi:MAG: serine--tRNA ligase [Candidatus Aenigmatarchaeota archaeon]
MLDIKLIRENPDMVRKNLERRHDDTKLNLFDELLRADKEHRKLIQETEELRARRNKLSQEIAELVKAKKDASARKKEAGEIPDKLKKLEEDKFILERKINEILMRLPNMLHESVPEGKDDSDNTVVKVAGKPPKFDFEPKGHVEILEGLGLLDLDRAAKTAGHGFYYAKNDLVLLDYALMRFTMDFLRGRGYTIIEPPYMLHRKPYEGVTDVADFGNVMYKIENDDLYLIATSEHPMGAMYMDETLLKEQLPIRFCGVSPCFRKEVGAHGKYTKGIFRVHQFNKIEQFIFCLPDQSWAFHEELQKNSEDLYNALGLHYRVVNVCTGDIGSIAAKKYDIECWMADGMFRETGSNSNCTDYQARRLNIKYREKEGAPPAGFVHTLNNTAIATSRTMIAIIEQYQQKDGTVKIPEALQPYMGGAKFLGKQSKIKAKA